MATLVSEHRDAYGVIVIPDYTVIHDAMQMDDPVIVRRFDDGSVHVLSSRTGRLIVAPFKPDEVVRLRCPHCHGELGGDPPEREG